MNLEGILSIAGKPGLFKMVAQTKSGLIVESIIDKKRFPVSQSNNVSSLTDIAIYTVNEEKPLAEVFEKIAEKEDYSQSISHTAESAEISSYFAEILPEYDRERVYQSDLKKVFRWYNLLQQEGIISRKEKPESDNSEDE